MLKKYRLTIVLIGVGLSFVLLFAFLALLGENHKANDTVNRFFKNIQQQNYAAIYSNLSTTGEDRFRDKEECADFVFLFELALLKKFDLLEKKDYMVDIRKSHFWIPFTGNDQMRVDVFLEPQDSESLLELVVEDDRFIPDLLTLERDDRKWKIRKIDLDNPAIRPLYDRLRDQLMIERYVTVNDNILSLKENHIDLRRISPTRERLLQYVFEKATRLIVRSEPPVSEHVNR
ncbi:MAG: hypothetical protein SWH68_03520 [Thermodesulfobacteriota bacterium]|nr:hypothetical protein [Thermodesulfobacteriota bacterium]